MSPPADEARNCPRCRAVVADPEASFCARCGRPLGEALNCASCAEPSPRSARFCHACGKALAAGPAQARPASTSREKGREAVLTELEPVVGLAPPGKGLAIEFYGTSPGRYGELVQLARAHPSFVQGQGPEGTIYRVTFQPSEMGAVARVYDLLEGAVARRAFLDGRKVEWFEFFTFLRCYRSRTVSIDPESHCFWDESNNLNLWGCFRSGVFFGNSLGGCDWLSFGRFDSDNSFIFDKKRVIELLDRSLASFRLCPALDLKFVSAMLRVFPERVNPNISRDWAFWEAAPGENGYSATLYRKDPAGEKKVEAVLRGVRPASADAAVRIFAALKKRAVTLLQGPMPPSPQP